MKHVKREAPAIVQCGELWCIETAAGIEGPVDSQQDAAVYLNLLNRVNAARNEQAGLDCETP
ncbi:hypothetical protein [Thiohalophilus sp.]|uniref:hypothetical protein n=1 Tax=Thiohalophilus sp. TaxID=3028392 RepID=UPI0039757BE7